MLVFLQRVNNARVEVDGKVTGSIGKGLLILLGVGKKDSEAECEYLARRLVNLRIFNDQDGKMNLSLLDVGGEMIVISQFTLHADTKKGNRPSFTNAMPPEKANELYEKFMEKVRSHGVRTEAGVFGAHMNVILDNDGPVSIMLKSKNEY